MTAPTAAQIASDVARLNSLAAWLKSIDSIPTTQLVSIVQTLSTAAPGLAADYTAKNPGSIDVSGPALAVTNSIAAINNAYNALYTGAGYTSSGAPARLQNDASQLAAIATRVGSSSPVQGDVDWLNAEATFLTNLSNVVNDSTTGLQNAGNALSASGLEATAISNGDSAGATAVASASDAMNTVYNLIYPSGSANNPSAAILSINAVLVPDIQALLAPVVAPPGTVLPPTAIGPAPTAPTAAPSAALIAMANALVQDSTVCNGQTNTNVTAFVPAYNYWKWTLAGSPAAFTAPVPITTIYNTAVASAINVVLGAAKAPACSGLATVPAPGAVAPAATGMSTTTFLVGAAAVIGVGWLGWYLYKLPKAAASAAKENPIHRPIHTVDRDVSDPTRWVVYNGDVVCGRFKSQRAALRKAEQLNETAYIQAARARRISSSKGRCPDCGAPGELKGHQTCQYPRD